jgi:plasmid stability protein
MYFDSMPTPMQIRNVPEDARRVLKSRAAKAGKSLNSYLLDVIEREVSRPTLDEVFERVQQRSERSPVSSLKAVQQARDERSHTTVQR